MGELIVIVIFLFYVVYVYYTFLFCIQRKKCIAESLGEEDNVKVLKCNRWKRGLFAKEFWLVMLVTILFERVNLHRVACWGILVIACFFEYFLRFNLFRGCIYSAKRGVLFQRLGKMGKLSEINVIAMEKNGILMESVLGITETHSYNDISRDRVLQLAASLAAKGDGEMYDAIVNEAKGRNIEILEEERKAFDGENVLCADVERQEVRMGVLRDIRKSCAVGEVEGEMYDYLQCNADYIQCVAVNQKLAGILVLGKRAKEDAKEVLNEFAMCGVEPIVLTRENEKQARCLMHLYQMKSVFWGLNAWGKEEIVLSEKERGKKVAVVGEYVDDVMAMNRADVSFQFGTDIGLSFHAADAICLNERISDVFGAFQLAKQVKEKEYGALTRGCILAIIIFGGMFFRRLIWGTGPSNEVLMILAFCLCVCWNILMITRGIRLHIRIRCGNK